MVSGASPRIVLATRPVDFRRGHDALAATAAVELGLDIYSGVIVIFLRRGAAASARARHRLRHCELPRSMSVASQYQTTRPPLARDLPILGSVFSLLGDIRAFLTEQYLKLGPVFGINALNRKLTVLAAAEANVFANDEGAKFLTSRPDWTGMVNAMGAERAIASMDGVRTTSA